MHAAYDDEDDNGDYGYDEAPLEERGSLKAQVLSLGLNKYVAPSGNIMPSPSKDPYQLEKMVKSQKYRQQLEADKSLLIREDRKPFVRKAVPAEGLQQTLLIGKDVTKEDATAAKHSFQQSYQESLKADILRKKQIQEMPKTHVMKKSPKDVEVPDKYAARKIVAKRADEDGDENYGNGFQIGSDEGGRSAASRAIAKEVSDRNRAHMVAKVRSMYPQDTTVRPTTRQQEYEKYPTEGGFIIGVDEVDAAARKKEAQKAYFAALARDTAPVEFSSKRLGSFEYVEGGQVSLMSQIGGPSKAQVVRNPLAGTDADRKDQQRAYFQLLQEQKEASEEKKRLEKKAERAAYDATSALPYMKY